MFVSGFKRDVPKAIKQKVFKDICSIFTEELQECVDLGGPACSSYFYINFSSKDNLFAALDALKKINGPFKWFDTLEEENKDIIVRKNKSIEQRNTGKFNSHFYEVVKAVLE